jgi:glucose/arabinose dehydrogenase
MRTTRLARALIATFVLLFNLAFAVAPAIAATVPTGFTDAVYASGLSNPTAMAWAPDGRLFVTQQGGALRVIKNGALLSTPFLTVTVDSQGERGLLGVAFDPDFANNHFVYVYYTSTSPSVHNRVSRFTANGDVAVAGSELVLMDLNNLSTATNHNGGAIHFGPDGKLYIAVGENANSANSQSLSNVLGKMLRINPDGSIPTDNPYYNQTSGINRAIWAAGLRNPFTFAFQPGTGRMFINDVGQNTWEEIDDGIVGSNYGWPNSEGATSTPGERGPLYFYGHGSGNFLGCAITGGAFYNPPVSNFPSTYVGSYFFADYCGGWINRVDPANGFAVSSFATGISSPVDVQVGPDGALYYLARGAGAVGRITFNPNTPPSIQTQPANQTVSVGAKGTFNVAASGTLPLSYQWQRLISTTWTNIDGANASSYTTPATTSADNGAQFRVIVSNTFGNATSNAATLTVVSNTPPTGTITAPKGGAFYRAGDTITYSGTGTDGQDGTLPASAFTWQVDFHHDDGNPHVHPFIAATTGSTGGSFTIPRTGETSPNVFYRIILTVTDSGGLTHTSFVDIVPRTATITLMTNPGGLQVTLDGQPFTGPHTFVSVVGMQRVIGAPAPQTVAGKTYNFSSWSDRGKATHTITTPDTNTTYTATFKLRGKR